MSVDKNKKAGERWLAQALDDAQAAESLSSAQKWAQAAFFWHQAAEKSVKAVAYLHDLDPCGHSVTKLLSELPEGFAIRFQGCRKGALFLDKLYIPTRYPDSVPDMIPKDAFTEDDVAEAKRHAECILRIAEEIFSH